MELFLVLSMFAVLVLFLVSGFPVAFTLGGTGLLFGLIGYSLGILDFSFLTFLPNRLFENVIRNELLFAVPLFVSMGVMLEKSKVAEDLLESLGALFGNIRGGIGYSVTIVGALLAASTGIVGATVVTMGLLSLPTMLKRGYDHSLATGSIAAAGTLGQIIPPSIVLILLADVMSNAWQQAQRDSGVFSAQPMSAGELFAGALIPGLILVGLYILYQVGVAIVTPDKSPVGNGQIATSEKASITAVMRALLPPLFLILAVLGSILGGLATPTEAASVGAVGAILLGAARQNRQSMAYSGIAILSLVLLLLLPNVTDLKTSSLLSISGAVAILFLLVFILFFATSLIKVFRHGILVPAMRSTIRISTMIYTILIGAALFSLVFRGLGGDDIIADLLLGLPGGTVGALIFVMLLMFVLGFFLDFIEITFVVVPVVAPVLLAMDGSFGPIWLGVLMAMNLQTSFLTPPFGFALFYLRGVAPDTIKTSSIYKGALPFVIIQVLALILIASFPDLVTWLPQKLF